MGFDKDVAEEKIYLALGNKLLEMISTQKPLQSMPASEWHLCQNRPIFGQGVD